MKKLLLSALGTILVFTAGLTAGMWIQRTRTDLPPAPPTEVLSEFRDMPIQATAAASVQARSTANSADALKRQIDSLKPEVEAFRKKVEPIKIEFRSSLEALLSAAQKEKLKCMTERPAANEASSGDKRRKSRHDGIDSLVPIVLIPSTLEKLSFELNLNSEQRAAVHSLLVARRSKLLELVDASPPPPSLKLEQLMPQIAKPDSK